MTKIRQGKQTGPDSRPADHGNDVHVLLQWQSVTSHSILRMLRGDDRHSVLRDALDVMRKKFDSDRTFIFLFDHRNHTCKCDFEVVREGLPEVKESLASVSMDVFPWLIAQMVAGQPLFLDSLDDMPAQAAKEHEFLRSRGIRSIMLAPIVSEKGAWGCLCVTHTERSRRWDEMDRQWMMAITGFVGVVFELNRSQRKLAHEGEYLKSLYMNMPLGFSRLRLVYDGDKLRDFFIVDANQAMAEHTGLKRERLMLARSGDIQGIFDGLDDLIGFLEEVASGGGLAEREITNKSTGRHYRNSFYAPNSKEIVVLGMDITTSVEALAGMYRNEQMLRMVYENIPVAIEIYDRNADLISYNEAASCIFGGYKPGDVLGRNMFDWPSFRGRPDLAEKVRRGEEVAFDIEYGTDQPGWEGNIKHLSLQCTVVRDMKGEVCNYVLITIDNTEKMQICLDLKRFQHTFDSISEFSEVGMFEWDLLRNELSATEQWYKNVNLAQGSPINALRQVVHPEDYAVLLRYLEAVKEGALKEFTIETRVRQDKEWKSIKSMCQVNKFDPGRRSIVLFGLNVNISEMKQAEQRLLDAKLRAEESDRLKSAFLASMSHEIRTPLNAIVGFSELAIQTGDEKEKSEYIGIVNDNNDRLLQLVNDILDFSTIEAGILDIANEEIDANGLMEEMVDLFKSKLHPGVALSFVPPLVNVSINSDKNRLGKVLSGMLSNAVKFTRRGHILVSYQVLGRMIEFSVQDTGIGMTAEQTERVFDLFVKFDDFTPGTGLGLSVCKSIVEVMQGEIGVESNPGSGSRFWFRIPAQARTLGTGSNNPAAFVPTGRPLVLVAEDAELNYLLISSVLQEQYDLLHARNGIQAVELHAKHHPDLVIMDIRMPLMDGLEATRRIRQTDAEVPIVALTAYALDTDRKAAFEAGCTGFLPKPIRAGTVRTSILRLLEHSPKYEHEQS